MKAISGVKFATTFNGYEHSAHSMRLLRIGSTGRSCNVGKP